MYSCVLLTCAVAVVADVAYDVAVVAGTISVVDVCICCTSLVCF